MEGPDFIRKSKEDLLKEILDHFFEEVEDEFDEIMDQFEVQFR